MTTPLFNKSSNIFRLWDPFQVLRCSNEDHAYVPPRDAGGKLIPRFPRHFHRTWNAVCVPTVGRSCKFLPWVFVWVLLQLQSWSWVSYKLKRCTNLVKKTWKKCIVSNWVYPTSSIPVKPNFSFSAFAASRVQTLPKALWERKPKLQSWSHVETTHHWISDVIWTPKKRTCALIETWNAAVSAMPRIVWKYMLLRYNFLDDFQNPMNHSWTSQNFQGTYFFSRFTCSVVSLQIPQLWWLHGLHLWCCTIDLLELQLILQFQRVVPAVVRVQKPKPCKPKKTREKVWPFLWMKS